MIRTLIVDDDERFRCLIKGMLLRELGIDVIGEAENGQNAIFKAEELKPEVVLMDIRMPGMNGLETTSMLKKAMPGLKVIILTILDMDEYKEAAKAVGADGYILKKSVKEDLIREISSIYSRP
jgi:DNA-binding NarL/FixJ family response regulator